MSEAVAYRPRQPRAIVQGTTFTETMVLTIVNQLMTADGRDAYREQMHRANMMLMSLVLGDISLEPAYKRAFLEIFKTIYRERLPQLPPFEPSSILTLGAELLDHLAKHGEKILGRAFLVKDSQDELMEIANEIIFTTIIAFFKKTGGLSDARPPIPVGGD